MQQVKRVFVLLSGFLLSKIGSKLSTGSQVHIFPYHTHLPVTCLHTPLSTQSLPCPGSSQGPQGTFTFLCPSYLPLPPPLLGGRDFQ